MKKENPGVFETLNALNTKFNTVVAEIKDTHASELKERDEIIADLRNQIDGLQQRFDDLDITGSVATGIANADLATSEDLETVSNEFADYKEITVTVQDLTNVREAIQDLRKETASACNDITDRMGPLSKTLDAVMNTVDTLSERLDGGTERENAIRADIDNLCGRVTEIFGFVSDFDGVRAEITQEIADSSRDISDRFVATFDKITQTLDSSADAIKSHKEEIERINDRLTDETKAINDNIVDTVQAVKDKTDDLVKRIDDTAADINTGLRTQIETVNERIAAAVCSLPKNLVINSDGDLVGIDANGDTTVIGKVGGNVIDAKIHNNKLTLHLSDGRKIDAGSVVDLKPKKSEAEQKKDKFIKWFENKPKADKVDVKAQAKKYNVTIQTIYRWINASGKNT